MATSQHYAPAAEPSDAARLRVLYAQYREGGVSSFDALARAESLLHGAISAGAFDGPEYAELRDIVARCTDVQQQYPHDVLTAAMRWLDAKQYLRGTRDHACMVSLGLLPNLADLIERNLRRRKGTSNRRSQEGPPRDKRKRSRSHGQSLTKNAKRGIVLDYVKEHGWDGTLPELRGALKREKGLDVSEATLSRYLKGVPRRLGRPHRAAGGKGEREAVHCETYTVPDED